MFVGYFRRLCKIFSPELVEMLQKVMRLMPAQQFLKYIESLKGITYLFR